MKFEMPIIIISTIALGIYFAWSKIYKKKNAIEHKISIFRYIILPMLLYFLVIIIAPFIIFTAFPESHGKVGRIFQIFLHLTCFLYLAIVDFLVIKGNAKWFLEKQSKNESKR